MPTGSEMAPTGSGMGADLPARMAGPSRAESMGVSLRVSSLGEKVHPFGKDARERGDSPAGLTTGDLTRENAEPVPTGRSDRSVRLGDRFEQEVESVSERRGERSRLPQSGLPPGQGCGNRVLAGRAVMRDGSVNLPVG